MFNPARLTVARKRRGFTKIELAGKIGVDLRSIVAYEAGTFAPRADTFDRIESVLGFGREFFYRNDLEELNPDGASFRAMSKMSTYKRDMALAQGAIAIDLCTWLEKRFVLPSANLPDLSREPTPEEAADSLRRYWGIGELPVKNMIHLLESKGVRVFSLSIDAREVDAFSMWRDATPFVFLNTQKTAEHSRFDAAHELGHLVLHRHAAPHGREAEREADAFASAFLMPRGSVLAHAPRFATLPVLIKLKKTWITSLAALTYRLHSVGALSDWNYRGLYIEIGKRGYRMTEPEEAPRETSQVLAKMFAALYEDGVTRADIAQELCIPVSELEQLVFGLVMTGIEGGRRGKVKTMPSPDKPSLRLVVNKDRP
jgi:Zn-dependent peptidase ImmA (M78 family)/DNA-binding XRE family transcriptional regulator